MFVGRICMRFVQTSYLEKYAEVCPAFAFQHPLLNTVRDSTAGFGITCLWSERDPVEDENGRFWEF